MLKKYIERDQEVSEEQTNLSVQQLSAVILQNEDEIGGEIDFCTTLQRETFRDVEISSDLSESQRQEVVDLLEEIQYVFTDVPALTTLGEHSITLTTDEPVHSKPYPIPHAMQETVDRELENMLQMRIIEPSTSPYASPIVVVRKSDGSNRVCVDYREFNKITVFDPEPMPQPEQVFSKLEKDRYFSTFDVTKGYWQIPMNANDKAYTAFVTHKGLHQFRVMPFGLVNAPATFNRLMRKLLHGSECLDNYVDDVLTHTPDWQNHLKAIRVFYRAMRCISAIFAVMQCLSVCLSVRHVRLSRQKK